MVKGRDCPAALSIGGNKTDIFSRRAPGGGLWSFVDRFAHIYFQIFSIAEAAIREGVGRQGRNRQTLDRNPFRFEILRTHILLMDDAPHRFMVAQLTTPLYGPWLRCSTCS